MSIEKRIARLSGLLSAIAIGTLGAQPAAPDAESSAARKQFTFSWQFAEDGAMRPRGGTSRGTPVDLVTTPTAEWEALQEPGLRSFERDRRAILAMAGPYRTSFDFLETVQFTPGAEPVRPYQSWGTEYVYVAEDQGDFISLQHIIVMFFEGDGGEVVGPAVQKHWRQDWRYEDTELHVHIGHNRWQRRQVDAGEAEGRWTQAVFQVDDAPRYESIGRWVHSGNYSSWTGKPTWRPLPRRESSVRDDYDVLEATNTHTIVPTGWVHEENNLKLDLDENGEPADETPYLARELGVNRYERIEGFDFSAGHEYWESTGAFWSDVRDAWQQALDDNDRFALADRVDDRSLFEYFFEYAYGLESEPYDAEDGRPFIAGIIDAFVTPLE